MLIGNFGQSQTTVPIQPAGRLTSPAYTFGPVIPVGRLAQASNAPVGPSSNSSTNQACQYRPSSNRSAYKTPPIRPSRTPQSQTDLSDLHALAQGTKNFPTNRIKQDFNEPPQRSGTECFFCKRDLSFTPEADCPISQPSIPPSVAVLPCGHYFHIRCLKIHSSREVYRSSLLSL
ncbi:uncharacterized protein LOC116122716 isoform X2 [Pistacia vera]|uniref:uncharacterized protein LOC116122716 isoform X2 n=1 Tax=Pistacia vera TaxID=55513 RepID=UPI001262E469|nr:uncharacterized protein LOC116122716 isoform X2 [Pistacia vera]